MAQSSLQLCKQAHRQRREAGMPTWESESHSKVTNSQKENSPEPEDEEVLLVEKIVAKDAEKVAPV